MTIRGQIKESAPAFAALIAGVLLACGVIGIAALGTPARANPSTGPALVVSSAVPAIGPAFVDSFTVVCGDSATPIGAPRQISYTCQNGGTTAVAIGDSGVASPASQNSPVHCATNCPSEEWGGNVRQEFCRVASGTVTIYCRAMVSTLTAP